jgi:hypothetical protein
MLDDMSDVRATTTRLVSFHMDKEKSAHIAICGDESDYGAGVDRGTTYDTGDTGTVSDMRATTSVPLPVSFESVPVSLVRALFASSMNPRTHVC